VPEPKKPCKGKSSRRITLQWQPRKRLRRRKRNTNRPCETILAKNPRDFHKRPPRRSTSCEAFSFSSVTSACALRLLRSVSSHKSDSHQERLLAAESGFHRSQKVFAPGIRPPYRILPCDLTARRIEIVVISHCGGDFRNASRWAAQVLLRKPNFASATSGRDPWAVERGIAERHSTRLLGPICPKRPRANPALWHELGLFGNRHRARNG
jgi:hypothetical protein